MHAPHRAAVIAAAVLTMALAGGCSEDEAGTAGSGTPTVAQTATGDGRVDPAAGSMLAGPPTPNVADLLKDTTGEPILAGGYLFVAEDGTATLCDLIAESYPPQCGGASIPVENLPPELVDGLTQERGVRWSDEPVRLIGTVVDGVFVNDPELLAAS